MHPFAKQRPEMQFSAITVLPQFASVALVCVIGSIISIYTGIFVNWNGNDVSK